MLRQQQDEPLTKVYTDAAWNASRQSAGLGWVFSDAQRPAFWCGNKAEDYVGSLLIAEALAIRLALMEAQNMGINDLHVNFSADSLVSSNPSHPKERAYQGACRNPPRYLWTLLLFFFYLFFLHFAYGQLLCWFTCKTGSLCLHCKLITLFIIHAIVVQKIRDFTVQNLIVWSFEIGFGEHKSWGFKVVLGDVLSKELQEHHTLQVTMW